MARKMPGENEKMESVGEHPNVLEQTDLPDDGQSTVVGPDGKVKPLSFTDGQVIAPKVAFRSEARAPMYTIVKAPPGGSYLDPMSRMRASLLVGTEVNSSNYDLDAMRKQGFKLVASDTVPVEED